VDEATLKKCPTPAEYLFGGPCASADPAREDHGLKKITYFSLLVVSAALVLGSVLMQSGSTFGQETDIGLDIDWTSLGSQGETSTPAASEPLPPAAPLDPADTLAPAAPEPPTAASDAGVTGLPSAGSGGYLNEKTQGSVFPLLAATVLAVLGSGSLLLASGGRRR
jgi:hypothetical protein